MGTPSRYLILMIDTCSGFGGSHLDVAIAASNLAIEIVPTTLVSKDT